MPRRHGSSKRRQQNRRNRDRQQSRPQPTEPDRKPELPDVDPRDVVARELGMVR